jgi:hypothetical protein
VRVGQKSSFALKEDISTRTLCKSLISPDVGLLYRPPSFDHRDNGSLIGGSGDMPPAESVAHLQ